MARLSAEGRRFLQREEEFRSQLYLDSAGVPTIGWGHAVFVKDGRAKWGYRKATMEEARKVFPGPLLEQQAEALFSGDVYPAERAVSRLADGREGFSQQRVDALVSLVFNIGTGAFSTSKLRRVLLRDPSDPTTVDVQWRRWAFAGGKFNTGLYRRRYRELDVYWLGDYRGAV